MEQGKPKTRAQMIIDGDIEPEKHERGLLNLRKRVPFNQMPEEKVREIRRKGAEAVNQLHGEKKSAKQSIERILTLKVDDSIIAGADIDPKVAERLKRDNPNATLYDLIQAVAVGRALDGNVKAMEYVRDTHGDKPVDKVDVTGNIMTDSDRELLQTVNARLGQAEITVVQDNTQAQDG